MLQARSVMVEQFEGDDHSVILYTTDDRVVVLRDGEIVGSGLSRQFQVDLADVAFAEIDDGIYAGELSVLQAGNGLRFKLVQHELFQPKPGKRTSVYFG